MRLISRSIDCVKANFKILLVIKIIMFMVMILNASNKSFNKRKLSADNAVNEALINNKTFDCFDKDFLLKITETEKLYIIQNYIKGSRRFYCHESVTFATTTEFRYIDNVIPIVKRWNGPISVAVYAPGTDLIYALMTIFYLRNCSDAKDLVTDLVTFHLFFDKMDDKITNILTLYDSLESTIQCQDGLKLFNSPRNETYRVKNQLRVPLNAGRNIATDAALTHFVLTGDIDTYPSPNFAEPFIRIITQDNGAKFLTENNAFVVATFEIENGVNLPETKSELINLYNNKKALLFKQDTCPECYHIPELQQWMEDKDNHNIRILATKKRQGEFGRWEPFFISTDDVPIHHETIYSDGRTNKGPQAYAMCILDYNFNVLSNGFLIRPKGMKYEKELDYERIFDMQPVLKKYTKPFYHWIYGEREECD